MDVYELIRKYDSNYSTLKHILMQYNRFGKTDRRKFKRFYIEDDDLIKANASKVYRENKVSANAPLCSFDSASKVDADIPFHTRQVDSALNE